MRIAGRGIDRCGSAPVAAVGTAILLVVLYLGFIAPGALGGGAIMALFVSFMIAMSIRNVSMSSLSTRVPARRPARRLHVAAVDGAAHRVRDRRVRRLAAAARGARRPPRRHHDGRDAVGVLALALPPLLAVIGRRVRVREAAAAAASH